MTKSSHSIPTHLYVTDQLPSHFRTSCFFIIFETACTWRLSLQHFSVFPCVVRSSENLRPWDTHACGHSTRPRTLYNAFSNAFAAFSVNNQASFNLWEVWRLYSPGTTPKLGTTVNTRIAATLVIRGSATLQARSFQLVHWYCFLTLAFCHIGTANGRDVRFVRDSTSLGAGLLKIQVFLDVTRRLLHSYWRFGKACRIHLQCLAVYLPGDTA